jgi:protein TonB
MPESAAAQSRTPGRVLRLFLGASLAAHAAVIVLAPEFSFESMLAGSDLLEVTIERPAPPMPVEPEQQAAPVPAPQTAPSATAHAKAATRPRNQPRAPVAAVPAVEPAFESPATADAPQRIPERQPTAAAPAAGAENRPVTAPSATAAYLRNPPPQYPMTSRMAGEEGTVILRVLVKRDGMPGRVEIKNSSGWHNLDAVARDAVWKWRFVPGREGNDPVEATMDVPITFRLKEAAEGLSRNR